MREIFFWPEGGPYPTTQPVNGIQQVINAQIKHLPASGWSVTKNAKDAEISASHAGASNHVVVDVAHCHGLYPTGEQEMARAYYEINARVIADLRQAKIVTVPSQWVGDILRRDMHLSPYVVPHGIDVEEWPTRPLSVGTPENPIVLWNKNRGDMDVCHTQPVRDLAHRRQDLSFTATFCRDAPGNVNVTGVMPHNEMRRRLYESHLYLATTRETFGIATVEAMAAGLPVVGFDWGATPDIVTDDCGILVPPGDIGALEVAINNVLGNWERYSRGARQRAEAYDWKEIIPIYAHLYDLAARPHEGPIVTVVIPCHNYGHKVGRAINSVKLQTLADLECLVVDDGSADNSAEVIKAAIASDARFRLIQQKNSGVAEARNRGFREARGRYICPLDADDAIAQDFLATVIDRMEQDPDCYLGYSSLQFSLRGRQRVSKWPPPCDFDAHIKRQNQVPTCNVMRKEAFLRTGGYRQRFHPAEDAELWLRIGALGMGMKRVTERPLFFYDFHEGSASSLVRSGQKVEPDWLYDHPWVKGFGHTPFASISKPPAGVASHPVINYDQPVVSIIIPVGEGHEEHVKQALDSVESQTDWRWECVVVDDTPGQNLTLQGFPWAKLIRTGQGGRKGPGLGRNLGVKATSAPLIVFLDADDFLLPPFLEETIQLWSPGTYVYTDYWDELGDRKRAKPFDENHLRVKAIHSISFLHERKAWEAAGGIDEDLAGWEDWDYSIAIAAAGYCGIHLNKALLVYRFMEGKRREISSHMSEELAPLIRGKWRDIEMGCCGGSRRKTPTTMRSTAPAPAAVPPAVEMMAAVPNPFAREKPGDHQLVQVRYTGANQAAQLLRSPHTGIRYRYGRAHSILRVNPQDVEWILAFPWFELHTPPEPAQPAPMAAVDAPAPENADQFLPDWAKPGESMDAIQHPAPAHPKVAPATPDPETLNGGDLAGPDIFPIGGSPEGIGQGPPPPRQAPSPEQVEAERGRIREQIQAASKQNWMDLLRDAGISDAVIERLNTEGFGAADFIDVAPDDRLLQIQGVGKATLRKLREAVIASRTGE